jgi:hypothetical protein
MSNKRKGNMPEDEDAKKSRKEVVCPDIASPKTTTTTAEQDEPVSAEASLSAVNNSLSTALPSSNRANIIMLTGMVNEQSVVEHEAP